jgi:hypothetical protein
MSDEELSLEEAVQHVAAAFQDYDNQSPENQQKLRQVAQMVTEQLAQADAKQRELARAEAARKREQAQNRKAKRDALIPTWCEENLQPGMIVKVKAKNNGLRLITEVKPHRILGKTGFRIEGEVRGQHIHFDRRTGEMVKGDYITNHILTNAQAVMINNQLVPIMELIEGTTK